MTRKDNEKDAERPHYYSQFWLDVAAGRRIIGAPKPGEEAELGETDVIEPTPIRRAGYGEDDNDNDNDNDHVVADGRSNTIIPPATEPTPPPDEFIEPDSKPDNRESGLDDEELDLQNVDDSDIPDITAEEDEELYDEEEDEAEEESETEEEEEEEDDLAWGGRGRKKAKPSRPVRQPKKPVRRDTRRGY